MDKKSQDFSIEKIRRLAQSDAGRQLMTLIRQHDPATLQQAADQAAAGNYDQAQQSLSSLLASPQIRALLQQMGREQNG